MGIQDWKFCSVQAGEFNVPFCHSCRQTESHGIFATGFVRLFIFSPFFNDPFYRAISEDAFKHAREVLYQNKVHLINYLTREMFAQPVPFILHVTMQALSISNHQSNTARRMQLPSTRSFLSISYTCQCTVRDVPSSTPNLSFIPVLFTCEPFQTGIWILSVMLNCGSRRFSRSILKCC